MGVNTLKHPKKLFIMCVCIVLIGGVLLGACVARAYNINKICGGISAGGVSLSNLSKEEAVEKMREKLSGTEFDKTVTVVLGDVEKNVLPSDFLAAYDYETTAEKALSYAHEGSMLKRIGQAFRAFILRKDVGMEISVDDVVYNETLDSLMTGIGDKVQEHTWEIEDGTLVVTTGTPGLLPDRYTVSEAILEKISDGDYKKPIVFKKESRNPSPLSAETLYDAVYSEASDASYSIEDGKVIMRPHTLGISFDKERADEIIDAHPGHGVTFEIPLTIREPEVTLEDIEEKLFSEVIGEYSTTFKTSQVSRSKNILLASNKINGTILAPDEIFSYNDVVGERSYSEGFEEATVYMNGESVPGLGGGICQVSSTLFNAVVFADLEIVERVNHQLTVSYVPLGRDATVDYGNIDFRFKNTSGYPVKILSSAEDGVMYMAILGYKEDKSKSVSFETVTIGHTEAPEKKVDDPTLPLGEEKVESEGTSGYIVDTYKITKRDGEEADREYLCRSNYRGALRIIHVGTGEAVPSPTPGEGEDVPPEGGEPTVSPEGPVLSPTPGTVETPQPTLEPTEEPVE